MKKVLPAALLTIAVCFPLSAQYAISNVSVIPMTADTVMVNQTVVVEEGVIKTIGSTKDVRIKRSLKVIDGSGKFLMPGLMDMHTHFFSDVGDQRHMWDKELKLMVSNGITTARLMTGHPSYLELRKKFTLAKFLARNCLSQVLSSRASGYGRRTSKTSSLLRLPDRRPVL